MGWMAPYWHRRATVGLSEITPEEPSAMQVATIGLDLAKIVCSQSAKRLALAFRPDGDRVPDLDDFAGDDHAVDEQFQ